MKKILALLLAITMIAAFCACAHRKVFAEVARTTLAPDAEDEIGFDRYLAQYRAALESEKAAVQAF